MLHILQKRCLYGLHIGNNLIGPLNMDMGMHPRWKGLGSIHILNNKVGLLIKLLLQCSASPSEG